MTERVTSKAGGVLIDVPVMPAVVKVVNSTRGWYERGVCTIFLEGEYQ